MFYIDHIENGKVGIADSDDGVIEFVDANKVQNLGVAVLDWNNAKKYITSSMNRNCNYHLLRKLQRGCSTSELSEYLTKYSVYTISQYLNLNNCYIVDVMKIFSYIETNEFISFVLKLSNSDVVIVRVTMEYECYVDLVGKNLCFKKYPSCAGNLIYRLAQKHGLNLQNIQADDIYLMMYSADGNNLFLFNQFNSNLSKYNVNNIVLM
jgi:hypothetical protein